MAYKNIQQIINLKDNSPTKISEIGLDENIIENFTKKLYELSSCSIKELQNDNDILFFSHKISKNNDNIEDYHIFYFNGSIINTTNVVGFLSINDIDVNIRSRFSQEHDYFFYYLLHKVFGVNITELKHSFTNDRGFSFLLFLFPYYFSKALRTGMYKKYMTIQYNNCHVKGTIDFQRHINNNLLDKSKIAYNVREHSVNNNITHLLRHTIEYIKTKPLGYMILNQKNIKEYINQIIQVTPDYNKNQRQIIINKNLKRLVHPYYYKYEPLRKLCIQILRYEKLLYNKSDKKIYGILFNIAWLWEEYINTLLYPVGFTHFGKRIYNDKHIYLLKNRSWEVFPDFFHEKNKIVLDTKYKNLDKKESSNAADKHQLISYMYTLHAEKGGFIYPSNESSSVTKFGEVLNLINSDVSIYPINIFQNASSIEDFINHIAKEEEKLKHYFL